MPTFAQKLTSIQRTTSAKSKKHSRPIRGHSREVNSILCLQRTIGNQAVQRISRSHAEELKAGSTGTASPHFGFDSSRIPVTHPRNNAIQAKLAINKSGDEYEQEADRVAEKVMRMPEPRLQHACACGGGCSQCQMDHTGQERARLQTRRLQTGDTGQIEAPPKVHEVLAAPGQPLNSAIREFMEPRFGHDFSRVRIHADPEAAASAEAVSAHAYTVGHHIVFGHGQYNPSVLSGRHLLAHELSHVEQQGAVKGFAQQTLTSDEGSALDIGQMTVNSNQLFEPPSGSTHR